MEVAGDARTSGLTDVHADVDAVTTIYALEDPDDFLSTTHNRRANRWVEGGEITTVHPRCNHQVTVVVRKTIEQNNDVRITQQYEPRAVVGALGGFAEKAAFGHARSLANVG